MDNILGPTFGSELLKIAGPLPISWTPDGNFHGWEKLTDEQKELVHQTISNHDPSNLLYKPIEGGEFLGRLTDEEYIAITSSNNVQIKRWIDLLRLRGYVDVSSDLVKNAKQALVLMGFFTEERANVIFKAEPIPQNLPDFLNIK